MPHVITQQCCNDASCVSVCPVNCIHPTPDEPDYARAEMLYIDPATCIDCGACTDVDVCPVDAIVPDSALTPETIRYADLNARYFNESTRTQYKRERVARERSDHNRSSVGPLRVAIVGSGPSACYAADELTTTPGLDVEVHIFDRLPTPWGLVRYGVAPDHQHTKSATRTFERMARRPGVFFHLGVEIGTHLTHDELLAHHHAVIYAVGAPADKRLDIPGEDLPGSVSATDLVGWYNGHPDHTDHAFDLSTERAVILGNGNVALDIARILTRDVAELARTDIAGHALSALADSGIREVVVVGRRDPAHAAYTTPELLGLAGLTTEVELTLDCPATEVDHTEDDTDQTACSPTTLKALVAEELALRRVGGAPRRIVLRYLASPVEIVGGDRVRGIRLRRNEMIAEEDGRSGIRPTKTTDVLECGLVVRSVGYRGRPMPGLPFDIDRGIIPNHNGKVVDPGTGETRTGVYVTGWIKRGPSGVIGTNKHCSIETVTSLLDDHANGRLTAPAGGRRSLFELVRDRRPNTVDYEGWQRIDKFEQTVGQREGRPRVKIVDTDGMLVRAQFS
ncbi:MULTISPECIES: FAD-dependent oxidoreductase [Rhodococcus]|uniref:ferredoxin--NADP(+) reductase n=1 Tax=Rhodococcus oxybenzonivorans TaxID=1990687 RepID=A0AAE4UXA3_9NOCA|nr:MULTISPECIES: FAD-dependent oxidoreductase [Rhodococcus]MDV7241614.1 ferredoxin [Rhodococcus oxybenzonivorans]MDV7264199.1 ferredoxin [Rhodococcus oxybenzonivorans]MDV7273853.1 ferredoxin [Rhodococcus oxybenzonivorans]MDV7333895.1 ferredoxin [Rhodococcus oxybenzonivorans]MDV7343314.1 ferredoxin [Rhodococcus oxybenzonivorans]